MIPFFLIPKVTAALSQAPRQWFPPVGVAGISLVKKTSDWLHLDIAEVGDDPTIFANGLTLHLNLYQKLFHPKLQGLRQRFNTGGFFDVVVGGGSYDVLRSEFPSSMFDILLERAVTEMEGSNPSIRSVDPISGPKHRFSAAIEPSLIDLNPADYSKPGGELLEDLIQDPSEIRAWGNTFSNKYGFPESRDFRLVPTSSDQVALIATRDLRLPLPWVLDALPFLWLKLAVDLPLLSVDVKRRDWGDQFGWPLKNAQPGAVWNTKTGRKGVMLHPSADRTWYEINNQFKRTHFGNNASFLELRYIGFQMEGQ